MCGDYSHMLSKEVNILLQKRVIEPVPRDQSTECYWMYFLVPKKTGDLQPILDLKPMNKFIDSPSFKMETSETVSHRINPNDWMASLDLKDA